MTTLPGALMLHLDEIQKNSYLQMRPLQLQTADRGKHIPTHLCEKTERSPYAAA